MLLCIAFHLEGKSPSQIFKLLENKNIIRMLIHRTIKRYEETGFIEKRYNGGRKNLPLENLWSKLRELIRRNPRRSANEWARSLKISDRHRCILKNDLQLKPYKIQKKNMTFRQLK